MACLGHTTRGAVGVALVWLAVVGVISSQAAGLADLPISTDTFPNLDAIKTNAVAGNARAQFKLGDYYFSRADFTNAAVWYHHAAQQGHRDAQLSLSSCYMHGRGVPQDPVMAAHWSKLGASQQGVAVAPLPAKTVQPAPKPLSNPAAAAAAIPVAAPAVGVSTKSIPPSTPASAKPEPKAATASGGNNADFGGRLLTLDRIKPALQPISLRIGSYDQRIGSEAMQRSSLEVARDTTVK